ncbi:hypothetical protein a10_04512 [Streptomyces acidiscabies]|nr:hypothetical protein a10_04512 [Streptomyces acidiscabies]GAV41800.1 hypothetical protein Saa2_04714 [Streptomyces acidiscabies]
MSLQRAVGNAAVANMVRGGQQPPTALPAVQRMPPEESPAQEPRSVFESDSESESDSGSEATATVEDTELPFHKSLRALRTVIRQGMNSAEAHGKPWTVKAKIDPGAPWTSAEFRNEDAVGHVWIEVTSPLGDSTEFGFYPQEPSLQSVPGVIVCPDRHGGDKEQKTARVGIEAVLLGYHAAFARTDATYNLATYNCAGFASDIWESMTGKPLPNGLLIANPASASESVRTERELREAFAGQQTGNDLEDLIEMASSGLIPPAL